MNVDAIAKKEIEIIFLDQLSEVMSLGITLHLGRGVKKMIMIINPNQEYKAEDSEIQKEKASQKQLEKSLWQ